MPNEQEARRKLQLLAGRVQGRITTLTEDARLDRAIQARHVSTRRDVREVLAEGLQKSASEIQTALANTDDSDRLIDDIVNALNE